ncbi:MAG: hypothetical protein KDM81_05130, partial [Verrucomicrobiae bacterium]|nr:hypothetical protein [Verrucomicrobiae bacterium]
RFRRAFNPAITQALWRVLQQAVAHRTTLSIEAKTGLTGALLQEARRRVDAAVLADTIALDY